MTRIEQANSRSLLEILDKNGFSGTPKGNKVWFNSPFHSENRPSFVVDMGSGKWQDFSAFPASDPYKSNVDFIILYERMKGNEITVSQAINLILEGDIGIATLHEENSLPYYEIVESLAINRGSRTESYILSRGINIDMARKYCVKLRVKYPRSANSEKVYSMVGFKNNSGGYEVRNSFIKSTLTPNAMTKLQGTGGELIFEGFFNFLSYVTVYGDTNKTVYVLNGAGNWKGVSPLFDAEYWGDNGSNYNKIKRSWVYPGDELLNNLRPLGRIKDMRYVYAPYEDLNDYLRDCSKSLFCVGGDGCYFH